MHSSTGLPPPTACNEPLGDKSVSRMHTLDLLRGICAFGVVVYHFMSWTGIVTPTLIASLLGFFGLYGVSLFFMLSGYSLAVAYEKRFLTSIDAATLTRFLKRRIARLLPLFLLVAVISVAGKLLVTHKPVDPIEVLANFFLLFGFLGPTHTPVIGGWSIGIEVVFYLIFPLLLILRNQWRIIVPISAFMTFWLSAELAEFGSMEEGRFSYTHPANHLIFFACGVFLHAVPMKFWQLGKLKRAAVIGACLVGASFIGAGATELELASGWRRPLLIAASLAIFCMFIAHQSTKLATISQLAGRVSYPLYLIHPIIYFGLVSKIATDSFWKVVILGVASIAVAAFIDIFFDQPVQKRLQKAQW